jgi:acyl-CoA synthetase (AMP-forming)/AMP-acid ligase II
MPLKVVQQAISEWPHVGFVNAYGLTETSSTISLLGPDEHRIAASASDPAVRARLSSVGKPLDAIEVQIRAGNGTLAAPGVAGTIWVRGPQVSGEYAGAGSALDDEGYFNTRDQGYLDSAGYLFVQGRVDDTIIRGGENIAPAEIEDAILAQDDVAEAVVVGIADPEWGQRIEAVVVPRPGRVIDPEEVRAQVRHALRGSKTPDRVLVWSELPRTDTGKVVRREVRARIECETSS